MKVVVDISYIDQLKAERDTLESKVGHLQMACINAARTLRNLAQSELSGAARTIAKNEASNLRDAISYQPEEVEP